MCTRVTLLLALCGTALSIINIKTDDSGLKECLQICTGRSAEDQHDWQVLSTNGAIVTTDISHCGFKSTPTIMAAVHGDGWLDLAEGLSGVFDKTPTMFRIGVNHKFKAYDMARMHNWYAEYIAIGYNC